MHVHVELSAIMNTLVLFSLLACISKEKSFASCLCIFARGCCRISLTAMKRGTWLCAEYNSLVSHDGLLQCMERILELQSIQTQEIFRLTTWTKTVNCVSPMGEVCVYAEYKCLFILFGCAMYPHDSLIIPELCMLTPPFPSLNVVTAGLNRMQVSHSVSLHERDACWSKCLWTGFSAAVLLISNTLGAGAAGRFHTAEA